MKNKNVLSVDKRDIKNIFLLILGFIIATCCIYYFFLPSINFHSFGFWMFMFVETTLLFLLIYFILDIIEMYLYKFADKETKENEKKIENREKWIYIILAGFRLLPIYIISLTILGYIGSSSIFNAKEYSNRITIKEETFSNKTISEVDFSKIPIIDRESTMKLGDKVMGEIPELVSQFNVSDEYTQISYKNSVYRVTPLQYAGIFKYFSNKDEGIPAYITVDSTNGNTKLVKLKDLGLGNMKYVPSALFGDNLERKLRFDYPDVIFGSPSFEVDEAGHPWYVCTTYSYKGINTKKRVTGMILFDPITGTSEKYNTDDIPEWVDRVYPESLVIKEVDHNGGYKDGFFNYLISQKGVTQTSDGYNYLEKDGDIWIYSGITSSNSDDSNLGFILVNLRTHEAIKFACSGAGEESAMQSAEGELKNYGYTATFPLLVNVNENPVYLLSLKDDNGLIKQYAMVDAKNYQRVSVFPADSIKNLSLLKEQFIASNSENTDSVDESELKEKEIQIKNFSTLIVDKKSKVFIIDTDDNKYKVVVTASNENTLAFLEENQIIKIEYIDSDNIKTIKTIK